MCKYCVCTVVYCIHRHFFCVRRSRFSSSSKCRMTAHFFFSSPSNIFLQTKFVRAKKANAVDGKKCRHAWTDCKIWKDYRCASLSVCVCVRRANTLNRETNLRNIQCSKIEQFIAQVSFTLPFDVCACFARCPSKRGQIPRTSPTNSLPQCAILPISKSTIAVLLARRWRTHILNQ